MTYASRDEKLRWMLPIWIIMDLLPQTARAQCHSDDAKDGGEDGDSDSDSDNDGSSSRTSSRAHTQCSTTDFRSTGSTVASATTTGTGADPSSSVALVNDASGDRLSGGSIAGIVIGLLLFLSLLFFLVWFFRRRYEKLRNLSTKSSIQRKEELRAMIDPTASGPIEAGAGGVGASKESNRHETSSSNDNHFLLPNPHPRDLPPLPPLGSDESTPSMGQRNSVILTYVPHSASQGVGDTPLSRGLSQVSSASVVTGPSQRRSLHEDMIVHQKDLEVNYGMGERDEESGPLEASGSGLAAIDEHPLEPPPQYRE